MKEKEIWWGKGIGKKRREMDKRKKNMEKGNKKKKTREIREKK